MMHSDNSQAEINKAVSAVKKSVQLTPGTQSPKYSGHESGSYGEGGPSAGGPQSKAPGTGGGSNSSGGY